MSDLSLSKSVRCCADARGLRARALRAVETEAFRHAVTAVIVVNAIVIGLETSEAAMSRFAALLSLLDRIALAIFIGEILLKLFAYRLGYFRSAWNLFDFAVVALSLIPAGQGVTVLRALRILRTLRLLSVLPSMRVVVQGLLSAIPAMGSVLALLALVFYVFAVMATKLFGGAFPVWFGSIGASLYSLFQVMTLESWSMGIVRPVMELYPLAWAFFVPFILMTTFAVLNLFIAILVNAVQDAAHAKPVVPAAGPARADQASLDALLRDVRAMRRELQALTTRERGTTGPLDGRAGDSEMTDSGVIRRDERRDRQK